MHLLGHQRIFASLCLLAVLHSPCHIDFVHAGALTVRLRRNAVCLVKRCVENNVRQLGILKLAQFIQV